MMTFAFYLFALSVVVSGFMVVISRNPVHSVLWLILAFISAAGLFVLQGAVAEPQLRLAVRHAREAGATPREIAETIWQMSMFGGMPAMQKALDVAQSVFAEEDDRK